MTNRSFDLICFGEVMLRLSPPENERIMRGEVFEKRAGGSELNVASGVSLLGLRKEFITMQRLRRKYSSIRLNDFQYFSAKKCICAKNASIIERFAKITEQCAIVSFHMSDIIIYIYYTKEKSICL